MATNFEFYLEKMKDTCIEGESVSICCLMKASGYLKYTEGCSMPCADCKVRFLEYLAKEHIEQPKLTKRERAFCEAVQTGWIARDKHGELYWYPENEKIQKIDTAWRCDEYVCILDFKLDFNCIKWEDEKPWSVEDLLKLEVMEE